MKDIEKTSVVDMVEEAFDVHREERRDEVLLSCGLDVVGEGESRVETRGVRASAELVEWHEFVLAEVVVDALGDDLLALGTNTDLLIR